MAGAWDFPGRALVPLLILFSTGCSTSPPLPRYIVTATPIDVVGGGFGVCIAVDPADAQGVWWWQPGPSGCASRTTGPTVFRGDLASVKPSTDSRTIDAGFTMQLIGSGSRDVRFVLQDASLRVRGSDVQVATERRSDLDIPPAYGR